MVRIVSRFSVLRMLRDVVRVSFLGRMRFAPGLLVKRAFTTTCNTVNRSCLVIPWFLPIDNTVDVIVFEYLVFAFVLQYFNFKFVAMSEMKD
jgi:hypothetical protein